MADFNTVAQQFTEFYYKTFDHDRKQLAALYRESSMLTFETSASRGVEAIVEKLTSLPFEKVAHKVNTLDAQPASDSGAILVMVTGALMIDEQEQPMNYTQVFHLQPEAGSFFVYNDIFKLIYG